MYPTKHQQASCSIFLRRQSDMLGYEIQVAKPIIHNICTLFVKTNATCNADGCYCRCFTKTDTDGGCKTKPATYAKIFKINY